MDVIVAASLPDRLRGLFGRAGFSGELLLAPCNDVHTVGMRRRIDVAFIASDGTVVRSVRRVGPFRRLKCADAQATIERFSQEGLWYEEGDKVQLKHMLGLERAQWER